MPIAPTLILGLGGTGSTIISKVAEKVEETGTSQSERISFVAFDTDINDLADLKRQRKRMFTVQTSTRNTVGEYLNTNTYARDVWFPVNALLNRKTLTEGAAQVRAISRLAFETTLKGGKLEPLHTAIDELFRVDKDQEEQALRVIITSSLAGGTGSGLILPLAMYLSDYLRSRYPRAKAITRGFFIQPDIFNPVIPAAEERNNLHVNAYATIRELDAFLMKGDATLPPEYGALELEFPRVGAEGVRPIQGMPYDFCFLFDANNAGSGSLMNFEAYLDHAATCIYTLSIGPMSKRSNSREDNVLREIIKHNGRNRYAGAGASRLVYPWLHVRDYVAMKWADNALSEQWLQFDARLQDKREARLQQRELGYLVNELDPAVEFIQLVDAAAHAKEPFARAVKKQCLAFDDEGLSVTGDRWSEYLTQLKKYVEDNAVVPADEVHRGNADNSIGELDTEKLPEEYVSVYQEIKKYHDRVEKHAEESAGVIGYTLFKADSSNVTRDRHEHRLETYLRDRVTGDFVHPVSARYFLYQTLEMMKAQKQVAQNALDELIRYFDSYESSVFDDPSTDDKVETAMDFASRKRSLRDRLRRGPGGELQDLAASFRNYVNQVDDFRNAMVYVKVLDDGIQYVTEMCRSFEVFFRSLGGNLKRLGPSIDMHRVAYDNRSGTTTRYVLASSAALDSLYASMPYTGGLTTIAPELSAQIYNKVRSYTFLKDEKDGNYFQDLYQNTILRFFKDEVLRTYQSSLQIDVIEALEREYRVTTKNFEEEMVDHYVIDEITKAKKLANPFIEQPLGEERHPIQSCAYHPKLAGEGNPKRDELVKTHLRTYGGETDEDLSLQEILFYNAIYSIKACDLTKYSPGSESPTQYRAPGQYFTAYCELVSGIRPSMSQTKVITPHIDRRWHTASAMPDLDEAFQAKTLRGIHSAFLAGLVQNVIVRVPVPGGRIYRYRPYGPGEQDFIAPNGTPCDQFYEVLASLKVDPVAVAAIHEAVERKRDIQVEEKRAVRFAESGLAAALAHGIELEELHEVVPGSSGGRLTVFDVAVFHSISLPQHEHFDDQLRQMSTDFLAYLREQVEVLEDDADVTEVLGNLLEEQFTGFEANLTRYLESEGPTFARRVRTILEPLAFLADDLHLRELAIRVESLDRRLREQ